MQFKIYSLHESYYKTEEWGSFQAAPDIGLSAARAYSDVSNEASKELFGLASSLGCNGSCNWFVMCITKKVQRDARPVTLNRCFAL